METGMGGKPGELKYLMISNLITIFKAWLKL